MLKSLINYQSNFVPVYNNFPTARYVNVLILRETESEAIFRTEGSGEPLSREMFPAGFKNTDEMYRIVISKRKQTAVERRTGREFLRQNNLLSFNKKEKIEECTLNANKPCTQCVDCWVYGYAVGQGGDNCGAQKSRVITEDSFSLFSDDKIIGERTFNALYETGTMIDPETRNTSSSINSSEYVRPGSVFLDVETLKDVTADEFSYVVANILASRRYGAISSRIGKMKNTVLAVVFSNTEIFSNMEWVRKTYDLAIENNVKYGDSTEKIIPLALEAANDLMKETFGKTTVISSEDLSSILRDVSDIYIDPKEFLTTLTDSYPKHVVSDKSKKGKKNNNVGSNKPSEEVSEPLWKDE